MELVYLWVEEYKNIKKQGFNFSPRFECKFFPEYDNGKLIDNCKLEIQPKEYTSIFPDNINITAIVGENGSGKSSLLLNIPNPQYIVGQMEKTAHILVYQTNKKIKISSNIILQSQSPVEKPYSLSFDYYSFNHDFLNAELIKDSVSYHTQNTTLNNHLLYEIYKDGNHYIDLAKYQYIINKIIFQNSNIDNLFSFNAKEIEIYKTFGNIEILLRKLQPSLEKETYTGEYQDSPINIYEYLFSNFDKGDDKEKFLIYVFLKHYESDKKVIKLVYKLFENIDLEIIDLKENIFTYKNSKLNMEVFKSFFDLIDDENINNKKLKIKELPGKLDIIFDLQIQSILNIEFYDDMNRKFTNLSHGERHIFSMVLLIYNKILEQDGKHKLILLDEPDNTLHPHWQKKLLNLLVNTFSKLDDISIHIILTSHSPFILSDLPKENVIFLKNGKQEYPFKDKQTFGANIHTLLSDGFFMSDGLMGEFAKGKIEEVIKYLNPEQQESEINSDKEAKDIINIIGEPVLQNTLLAMYDEKVYKNESKIDNLKRKQDELKKEIKKLEGKSDEES